MSEESMRQAVFSDPTFFGPSGGYDRTVFLDKLRNAGMDEKRFAAKTALLLPPLGTDRLARRPASSCRRP